MDGHRTSSVRPAFSQAALAFDRLVAAIDPSRLSERGTDEWTVRELIGHTARALLTIETTLAAPVDPTSRELASAAAYFRAAVGVPGVHAGITARGRAAGAELGDEPAAFVHAAVERVLPLVERTPDDQVVQHLAGRLAFRDYLETRTLELTLHAVDLQRALGLDVTAPAVAAALTRDLLLDVVNAADALEVACALTGRTVTGAFNLLG